jgi:hypothetical protein
MKLFKDIMFDEVSHTYFSKTTGEVYTSVTSAIKAFTKPFNSSFWLSKKSKDLGVNRFELEKSWFDKASIGSLSGSLCHLFIESLFKNKIINPCVEVPEDCAEQIKERFEILKPMAFKFVEDHQHLDILGQEMILHMGSLCGMADMITKNEDGSLSIYDYKTNPILKSYKEKMIGELKHIYAYDLQKFSIQLSCYQRMLEELGYTVKERKIVWLSIHNESYQIIDLEYLKNEAEILINHNYNTNI